MTSGKLFCGCYDETGLGAVISQLASGNQNTHFQYPLISDRYLVDKRDTWSLIISTAERLAIFDQPEKETNQKWSTPGKSIRGGEISGFEEDLQRRVELVIDVYNYRNSHSGSSSDRNSLASNEGKNSFGNYSPSEGLVVVGLAGFDISPDLARLQFCQSW